MKLHFFLPLLLSLEQTVAFSTRNLQDVTNDTIVVDENVTKPISVLFDTFVGNETEFINVSDSNGTFIIPASWLRGGLPSNDTTFIKVTGFNDTFQAIPFDFNVTDFPPEIRFKNFTEIMPNWRGGGDGNFTLIAMPSVMPDSMNFTIQEFLTTTSFDPNGTLGEGNFTLIAMPAVLPDFMPTPSENVTVFEDFVTITSFDPNGTIPVDGVGEGNFTPIAMPAVLPDVVNTTSENVTVIEDNVTITSFDPNGTLPVVGVGEGNFTPIAMPAELPDVVNTTSENVTIVEDNVTVTSFDPNVTLPVLGVGVPSTVDPLITEEVPKPVTVTAHISDWLSLVKKFFNDDDLKSCSRRNNVAPVTGDKCSKRKDKTCYFGTKSCPGTAQYPETRCKCGGSKSNRSWTCTATACP